MQLSLLRPVFFLSETIIRLKGSSSSWRWEEDERHKESVSFQDILGLTKIRVISLLGNKTYTHFTFVFILLFHTHMLHDCCCFWFFSRVMLEKMLKHPSRSWFFICFCSSCLWDTCKSIVLDLSGSITKDDHDVQLNKVHAISIDDEKEHPSLTSCKFFMPAFFQLPSSRLFLYALGGERSSLSFWGFLSESEGETADLDCSLDCSLHLTLGEKRVSLFDRIILLLFFCSRYFPFDRSIKNYCCPSTSWVKDFPVIYVSRGPVASKCVCCSFILFDHLVTQSCVCHY